MRWQSKHSSILSLALTALLPLATSLAGGCNASSGTGSPELDGGVVTPPPNGPGAGSTGGSSGTSSATGGAAGSSTTPTSSEGGTAGSSAPKGGASGSGGTGAP